MRSRRFQKFEEKFPEAIDTLARAVRAGHAFTTALEMIANELAEPVAANSASCMKNKNSAFRSATLSSTSPNGFLWWT